MKAVHLTALAAASGAALLAAGIGFGIGYAVGRPSDVELKIEAQRIVEADRAAAMAPVVAAVQMEAERLRRENQRKMAEMIRENEADDRAGQIDWEGFARDQAQNQAKRQAEQ